VNMDAARAGLGATSAPMTLIDTIARLTRCIGADLLRRVEE
jgi:hypothetical protein